MSPAIPALLAACVLLTPPFGVIAWKTFEGKLSWGLILTVGASISLARVMTDRIGPAVLRLPPYTPDKDFTGIALLGSTPLA